MSVAFIYDPLFLEHDTGAFHPESPDRLHSIMKQIEPLRAQLLMVTPRPATLTDIRRVHSEAMIDSVRSHAARGAAIDADTQTSLRSFDAALLAAGAGPTAIDLFCQEHATAAFAAVRPPGHHATSTESMGFCLFNNIAITARYARQKGFKRVLIIDFDVHHGNGTQEIFYRDDDVFYFSTHEYPAYPGSGAKTEHGIGDGEGYTQNFPLPYGTDDETLLHIYKEELPKTVERFYPDLILVSAGYDIHKDDPLADFSITTEGIGRVVKEIMTCDNVPKLFMLEGGYNLEALGKSVALTIKTMIAES